MTGGMMWGGWTAFLLAKGEEDIFQLVFIIFVGVVMLIGWLVQKSREKERREGTTSGPMGTAQPRQQDLLVDVRKFFEGIQQQEETVATDTETPPARGRRHRRATAVEQAEGEEGPAGQQGVTVVERVKKEAAEEEKKARALGVVKTARAVESVSLEQLVEEGRLSAGARAVILMEIMGSPRALRPYRATADEY